MSAFVSIIKPFLGLEGLQAVRRIFKDPGVTQLSIFVPPGATDHETSEIRPEILVILARTAWALW